MSAMRSPVEVGSVVPVEQLLARHASTGDLRARERAFKQSMPLARRLARRYHRGSEPIDDLLQVAYVGLTAAINRFDPTRGTSFSSFAYPTIVGELRRHFRSSAWAVHVPRGVQEQVLAVRNATDDLTTHLGRPPRVSELADATGLDREQVAEALEAHAAVQAASLDRPLTGEEGDYTLADVVGADDERFDAIDDRAAVGSGIRRLPRREREMLGMRFVCDMTQSEIAARMGCSQMQVSRVLRRSLSQLRAAD